MIRVLRCDAADIASRLKTADARPMLAYLDPPFDVGKTHQARTAIGMARAAGTDAYADRWPSMDAYLAWLSPRLLGPWDALADNGSLWLHLDHRTIHEAKVLASSLFGKRAFRGEIIWVPGNGGKARKGPNHTHQTILIFAKGKDLCWNGDSPALREPYADTSLSMHFTNKDSEGRRYRERIINGRTYRYFADQGRMLGSVWSDCPAMLANTPLRKETTGYPTQKPLKLLERIVLACTREQDWVLDAFCGSGTTLVAAAGVGRHAIACDIGDLALKTTQTRLRSAKLPYLFEEKVPPRPSKKRAKRRSP